MQDFSKNVVTTAGILIGITVTFTTDLLNKAEAGSLAKDFLYVAWVAALLAIGFGVLAHALIVRYLKNGTAQGGAVFSANASFFGLATAGLCFVIFGFLAINRPSPITAVDVAQKVVNSVPRLAGENGSTWLIKSLSYGAAEERFTLVVYNKSNPQDTFTVTTDSAGTIIKVQRS
jgi:hypothetical protein